MKVRNVVLGVLASATMLAMTACSVGGVTPASAASNTSVPASGAGIGQTTVPQQGTTPGSGITVVGVGQASGTPDVANVNIGVETQSADVQQAVADNRTKMAKLLETLKGLNIADKDISTSNYSVYTEQQPNPNGKGGTTVVAYHVNNQLNVTVRDVSKLGDVLDKVVAAGANNIYGVNFNVADTSKLQEDARGKAVADAKARAESLAKLAGVSLGDVVGISEVISSGPILYREAAQAGGGATPIQPGTLDVNMSVQVTFAIK